MRSCIYCGKELGKGEFCSCAGAVARRNAKNSDSAKKSNGSEENKEKQHNHQGFYGTDSNTYHTGYTRRENPIKSAWTRYSARKSAARAQHAKKSHRRNVVFDLVSFIKSPVETVYNPGYMSSAFIIAIAGLSGALIALCIYFMFAGVLRGAMSLVSNTMGIAPILGSAGFLPGVVASIIIGGLLGIVTFAIYNGVFWAIDKFMFKNRTAFWDFAARLILRPIPMALLSLLGLFFGLFSSATLAVFLFCGAVSLVALTYEALKTEWPSKSPTQVFYAMLLGFLVIGALVSNFIWVF